MNGIIGIASRQNSVPHLLQFLQKMNLARHNSWGLVVHGRQGDTACAPRLHRHRRAQPISVWMDRLHGQPSDGLHGLNPLDRLKGQVGMGHTGLTETRGQNGMQAVLPHISHGPDAHPNSPAKVAVVALCQLQPSNGLRDDLTARGYRFGSTNDSELLAHLIEAGDPGSPVQAIQGTLAKIRGSCALGVMFHDQPDRLFAVQQGMTLYWYSDSENAAWTSDSAAMPCRAGDLQKLEDGLVLELESCSGQITHRLHT